MNNISVDVDRFGLAVDEMLGNYYKSLGDEIKPVVKECCKKAKRECKELAASKFGAPYHEHYKDGFAYRVKNVDGVYVGEVGNRLKGGLTHLLEKGHARVGGGYVAGREHVSIAADKAFSEFEQKAKDAIKGAMS